MADYLFPPQSGAERDILEILGPLVPVSITVPLARRRFLAAHGHPADPSRSGYALIDTGATSSAVDDRVMEELEIPILDKMKTTTPHGEGLSNIYNASVVFAAFGDRAFPLEGALGCYLGDAIAGPLPVIMLLGRDLLKYFTLIYDGPLGTMTLQA